MVLMPSSVSDEKLLGNQSRTVTASSKLLLAAYSAIPTLYCYPFGVDPFVTHDISNSSNMTPALLA